MSWSAFPTTHSNLRFHCRIQQGFSRKAELIVVGVRAVGIEKDSVVPHGIGHVKLAIDLDEEIVLVCGRRFERHDSSRVGSLACTPDPPTILDDDAKVYKTVGPFLVQDTIGGGHCQEDEERQQDHLE